MEREGDGGEGGGFAGFHGDAAEMDGAVEGAFEGGFQEVEFAHGDAAGGDEEVDGGEGGEEAVFEGRLSGWCSLVGGCFFFSRKLGIENLLVADDSEVDD